MEQTENISTGQLYKNLFYRLKNLLINPQTEWSVIHRENRTINTILTEFSLPLIALSTLTTFINYIINRQGINIELALKQSAVTFCALFGGLYLAWFILKVTFPKFNLPGSGQLTFRILAYSSGLWYIITFITNLIPELFLLNLAAFYSIYIIWRGIEHLPGIRQDQKLTISIFIAILIHIIPYFAKYFLTKLITL